MNRNLPAEGYVRIKQIIGCRKKGIPAVIPVSRTAWFAGVKAGRYPAGKLISPGVRVWDVAEIRGLLK
jgi:prophage regulatory protein